MQELKTINIASDALNSPTGTIQETLNPFRHNPPEKVKNTRRAVKEWQKAGSRTARILACKKYGVNYYTIKRIATGKIN